LRRERESVVVVSPAAPVICVMSGAAGGRSAALTQGENRAPPSGFPAELKFRVG
jgi:hypothetical protein